MEQLILSKVLSFFFLFSLSKISENPYLPGLPESLTYLPQGKLSFLQVHRGLGSNRMLNKLHMKVKEEKEKSPIQNHLNL